MKTGRCSSGCQTLVPIPSWVVVQSGASDVGWELFLSLVVRASAPMYLLDLKVLPSMHDFDVGWELFLAAVMKDTSLGLSASVDLLNL